METVRGQHVDIIQTRDRELNLLNLGCLRDQWHHDAIHMGLTRWLPEVLLALEDLELTREINHKEHPLRKSHDLVLVRVLHQALKVGDVGKLSHDRLGAILWFARLHNLVPAHLASLPLFSLGHFEEKLALGVFFDDGHTKVENDNGTLELLTR